MPEVAGQIGRGAMLPLHAIDVITFLGTRATLKLDGH